MEAIQELLSDFRPPNHSENNMVSFHTFHQYITSARNHAIDPIPTNFVRHTLSLSFFLWLLSKDLTCFLLRLPNRSTTIWRCPSQTILSNRLTTRTARTISSLVSPRVTCTVASSSKAVVASNVCFSFGFFSSSTFDLTKSNQIKSNAS